MFSFDSLWNRTFLNVKLNVKLYKVFRCRFKTQKLNIWKFVIDFFYQFEYTKLLWFHSKSFILRFKKQFVHKWSKYCHKVWFLRWTKTEFREFLKNKDFFDWNALTVESQNVFNFGKIDSFKWNKEIFQMLFQNKHLNTVKQKGADWILEG